MKRLLFGIIIGGIVGAVLILVIITLMNTSRNEPDKGLRLVTNDSAAAGEAKKQQVLVYGDYMDLDSTDYLLIPLGMKVLENKDDRGLKMGSSDDYSGASGTDFYDYKYNFYYLNFSSCNNIIFYNKKSEETHLLLETPAVVSQFYFPYYNEEYKGRKYYFLLMGIHEQDTNGDGYINSEDAEKVYLTDLSGQNKIQITPENSQLIDWFIDVDTDNLLLKIRLDSNNDKKFDAFDELEIVKTSIRQPVMAQPIIGKEIKADIKKILNQIK